MLASAQAVHGTRVFRSTSTTRSSRSAHDTRRWPLAQGAGRLAIHPGLSQKPTLTSRTNTLTNSARPSTSRTRQLACSCGPQLYGTQGSRSPLVNWYLHEAGVEFELRAPRDPSNPHPFGQVPALRDDGGVEVWESGAILMYLCDKYGGLASPEARAGVGKWVVWANASLDPVLFIETPEGRVIDTGVRKPSKAMDVLEATLQETPYLVDGEFSVADVAVGAYLLYVPQFFQDVDMGAWPAVCKYMASLAARPAYQQAFGKETSAYLQQRCAMFLDGSMKKKAGFNLGSILGGR